MVCQLLNIPDWRWLVFVMHWAASDLQITCSIMKKVTNNEDIAKKLNKMTSQISETEWSQID